jgi:predicted lactoylglutathione lyase
VAFVASSREAVDGFYAAAMSSGGRDRAAPRIREEYHPGSYGGFVFDRDDNNIEAVFHDRRRRSSPDNTRSTSAMRKRTN